MILEIVLPLLLCYFVFIGYKKKKMYGVVSVLFTLGTIYLISKLSNFIVTYLLLGVVMFFFYSNPNIEDFLMKSIVLFSTLFLVGYWRTNEKNITEGLSFTKRGGWKYMGKKTTIECQKLCASEPKCAYMEVDKGASTRYGKTDCYIDILGTGKPPVEYGDKDVWENKTFKRPPTCPEGKKRKRGRKNYIGSDYRGCKNWTRSGATCQKWTSQYPHRHSRTPWNWRYKNMGLGNHNYCRNPDGEGGIWCYTDRRRIRWEYC